MDWKKWPSWVKGGVVGLGLAAVILVFLFISLGFEFFNIADFFGFSLNLSFQLSETLARFLGVNLCNIDGGICHESSVSFLFELIFPWLIYLLFYFIIGVLIGWIVGKLKK